MRFLRVGDFTNLKFLFYENLNEIVESADVNFSPTHNERGITIGNNTLVAWSSKYLHTRFI